MDEKYVNYYRMDWEDAIAYPSGTQRKVLRKKTSPITMLLRMPPGFQMDAHCHTTTEQHFVLEGEYISEGKSYGPGTYRLVPAGATHGPFTSEKGAEVLVVYDPR
jgi:anti-sigma factor ChrR (cupin superfamily)